MSDTYADIRQEAREAAKGRMTPYALETAEAAADAASDVWARYYAEKEAEVGDKSEVGQVNASQWKQLAEVQEAVIQRLKGALVAAGVRPNLIEEIMRG